MTAPPVNATAPSTSIPESAQAARMAAMERPVEMMARLPAARQRLMAAAFSGEIRLSM